MLETVKVLKARFVDTMIELGLGFLIGAILIGRVALPQFYLVSTAGWDTYTILVWPLLPFVLVAGIALAVIYHVKYQAWPGR